MDKELLIKKRTSIKGSITRLTNFIENFDDDSNSQELIVRSSQ